MKTKQICVNEICPTTSQLWVRRGALLVDVREEAEVEQLAFDVPNIINIPLSEFETRYKELPTDKNMVMVCHSGSRSLPATGFLVMNGYDPLKVVNLKHGIIRWVEKGFPTKGDVSNIGSLTDGCNCGSEHENEGDTCCSHSHGSDGGQVADPCLAG